MLSADRQHPQGFGRVFGTTRSYTFMKKSGDASAKTLISTVAERDFGIGAAPRLRSVPQNQ